MNTKAAGFFFLIGKFYCDFYLSAATRDSFTISAIDLSINCDISLVGVESVHQLVWLAVGMQVASIAATVALLKQSTSGVRGSTETLF